MSTRTPAPEEDVQWHRVHIITPVLNAWKVIVALFAVIVYQNVDALSGLWELRNKVDWVVVLLIGGAALLLFVLVLGGYTVLSWRMRRYAIGRDAVFLHSGILFRQQRHARLNRIQAVDVVQPLLARLFGLAKLKIETAGGAGSSVDLAFLKEEDAQQVRREVLARAAGTYEDQARSATADGGAESSPGTGAAGTTHPDGERAADQAPRAPVLVDSPERELLTVPPGRLIGSLLLSGGLITFVVLVAVLLAISIVARSAAPMFVMIPAVLPWGAVLWSRFATGFNFRAAISADGVRLRHGLLEQRTQTVRPGRVHAVALHQPLLWRRRHWWRVTVNIAGYGVGEAQPGQAGTVLLPVGPRGDALTALWLVLPDLGAADPKAVIDGALEGRGTSGGFTVSPRQARWLDPITWRRNGILLTERATLIRRGRVFRSLTIVPHERSQSLAISQGPVQRRARLASLTLALVSGPVSAHAVHLPEMTALALLAEQSTRARMSRDHESPEEWLRRVGLEPPAAAPPPPAVQPAPLGAEPAPPPPAVQPAPPGAEPAPPGAQPPPPAARPPPPAGPPVRPAPGQSPPTSQPPDASSGAASSSPPSGGPSPFTDGRATAARASGAPSDGHGTG